jgi:hypothetical protein
VELKLCGVISTMKAKGLDLVIGCDPGRLWLPTDCDYAGVRIGLRWGPTWIIMPKFWSKLWDHDHFPTDQATWFKLRLPFLICPFICVGIGEAAAYLGSKFFGSERKELYISMRFSLTKAGR